MERISKSNPSGSVLLPIKSENISSIGLSEFKATKLIIWGFSDVLSFFLLQLF